MRAHGTSKEPDDLDSSTTTVGRRTFFWALAGGVAGASIAGFVMSRPNCQETSPKPRDANGRAEAQPRLRDGVNLTPAPDGIQLWLKDVGEPVAGVNRTGGWIVERLNGQHTVSEIARELSRQLGLPHEESRDAKVAWFIAELGQIGLLCDPYYVQIVEYRMST